MTTASQTLSTPPTANTPSFFISQEPSPNGSADSLSALNIPQYPKKSGKWTPEEDNLLRKYVELLGEKQWRKISQHIPGRTSIQCLHRWSKILRPGLVKGAWTPDEDQKLVDWVKNEGPNKWAGAASIIVGRSGKQCRERWFNNLNPEVKRTEWTKEEDELIFELYQKHGSSWSKIAKFVEGRTENSIKNRFYSTLRRINADKKKNKNKPVVAEQITEEMEEENSTKSNEEGLATQPPHTTLYKLLQETVQQDDEEEEIQEQNEEEEPEEPVGKKTLTSPSRTSSMRTESPVGRAPQEQFSSPPSAYSMNREKLLLGRSGSKIEFYENREFDSPPKRPDNLFMFNMMQQRPVSYVNNNNFKPVSNILTQRKELSSPELYIPPLSTNISLKKEASVLSRQETSDLSNPVEIKLFDDAYDNSNDFKTAPLRFTPSTPIRNSYAINFNIPSRQASSPPQASPLSLNGALSRTLYDNSMGIPIITRQRLFQEQQCDSQPNSGLLKSLKTRKEMSQTSQSTQGSLYDYSEAELYKVGKTNEMLMAMSQKMSTATTMQQNCFSSYRKMLTTAMERQTTQNETQMAVLFNQLQSLEGMFSNVKSQISQLEGSMQERNPVNCGFRVKMEASEFSDMQGKRMYQEMYERSSPNRNSMLEMDTMLKKVRLG